jgi:hypothetical protein
MALRRIVSGSIGVLVLLAGVAAGTSCSAQDIISELNIFISPAGKPFRAGKDKPYPVVDWFAAANTAHDGKLTKAEFRADAEAFFHELDLNKDGVIDSRELAYYEKQVAPEIIASFVADNGRQVTPDGGDLPQTTKEVPQGGAWFGLLGEPEPVAAADINFDGKVTLFEFMKTTDERFALLDPKKRGYITLEDLPMTPVQARLPKHRKKH